jgi:hypothetical protein
MLAGLPWMCPSLTKLVDRPLVLALSGPGGGTWTIAPGEERVEVREGADPDAAATISSGDHAFVVWGTQRRPWRDAVEGAGDESYAAAVLDEINVI